MPDNESPQSSLILYQTEDGRTRIQCRFEDETIWLTQAQMAELFQTTPQNVTLHLKAIFGEGELSEGATCKDSLQVRQEGSRAVTRRLRYYSLPAILAVGYRVRSHRGTQFRQWATHGHTAAEIIHQRADATQPLMGLKTTRPGKIIRREDVSVAKNYLSEEELQTLNRIVNLYIEFAELQALDHKPMTMRNWIEKLDELLKISGRELLDHAGQISAETARAKAEREYDRYRLLADPQPRPVDADFEQAAKQVQKLPRPKKPKPRKP